MIKLKQYTQHLIKRGQIGQSIVILALGMIALLGFVGLTTDVSIMFIRYNNLRRAVDSAAIAAAGQVRQSSEGASSDVITRASMAARQFIEFHGLNPRDVWVEMCENQPRTDFAPGTQGLQLEPLNVLLAKEPYQTVVENMNAAIHASNYTSAIGMRPDYSNKADAYINALRAGLENGTPEQIANLSNAMDAAKQAWIADPTNENWESYVSTIDPLIDALRDELGLQSDDLGICAEDVRKLVRVTAQIDSPTFFLRLFNFNTIQLQASAISETAVLDVVLVMDVSQAMARDTSYEDWANINLGRGYVPPFLYGPNGSMQTVTGNLLTAGFIPRSYGHQYDIPHGMIDNGTGNVGTDDYMPTFWGTAANPINLWNSDVPPEGARSGTWYEWMWMEYILSEWPYYINQRLNFLEPNGATVVDVASNPPQTQTNPLVQYTSAREQPSSQYPVRSFIPRNYTATQSGHPREECRVRFFPYSFHLDMVNPGSWPSFPYSGNGGESTNIAAYYYNENQLRTNSQWQDIGNHDLNTLPADASLPTWGSFVPTYNFYGCCNDPTTGVFVSDGTEMYRDILAGGAIIPNGQYVIPVTSGGVSGYTRLSNSNSAHQPRNDWVSNQYFNTKADNDFSDLVCQPFKQAKDATRQFLRRIDFLRGDRVAFVTYDRSAFLVNPDDEAHMIHSYQTAVQTLDRVIGVRAEPNFYVWDEDTASWSGYAAGIDENGESVPLDYDFPSNFPFHYFSEDDISVDLIDILEQRPELAGNEAAIAEWNDLMRRASAAAINYPAYHNCSVLNAIMTYPFSIYATRNATEETFITANYEGATLKSFSNYASSLPALASSANPNFRSLTAIDSYNNTVANPWRYQNLAGLLPPENRDPDEYTTFPRAFQYTYERHSMCGGGNIGAALRSAHSALNDPRTSRREGSVWIIILLSDGAAGITSPVRRNGEKLLALNPYQAIERFDYQDFLDNPTADPLSSRVDNNSNRYGTSGDEQLTSQYGSYGLCPFGEVNFSGGGSRLGELITGDPSNFPWCSKSDPFERHFCLRAGDYTNPSSLQWVGFNQGNQNNPNNNAFGAGFMPNAWDREYRFHIAETDAAYEAELFNASQENRAPTLVRPMPDGYPFSTNEWLEAENTRLNNIFDVDLGNPTDSGNRCDPLYDPYDYARDWADFVTGALSEDSSNMQLPIIFTIGFGLTFDGDGSCEANIKKCLGEELLRYIADAGDNFQIDNDVQQDLLDDRYLWRQNLAINPYYPTLNGSIDNNDDLDWGPKDPCEPETYVGTEGPAPAWRPNDTDNPTPINSLTTRPNGSCGNYFNAPSLIELERVFDEIASRMFTRLSG